VSRIANLINEWNTNTNGSVYRNELREALRWDRNSDKGLGDLVEQFFKAQFHAEKRSNERKDPWPDFDGVRRRAGGTVEHLKVALEQSQRVDYKKLWSLIDEKNGKVSQVIEPIIASGWNFEDIRQEGKGRFDREPGRNEDFLRDMLDDDPYIDEMSQSQIGLLTALFKAWRYWHRRQSEGG
jgi:hypothetical protein